MLAASVQGQSDSAATTQRIGILRQLARWNEAYLPATDPSSVVQRMMLAALTGPVNDKMPSELLARHAYGSDLQTATRSYCTVSAPRRRTFSS
jgi:hypothetical protein